MRNWRVLTAIVAVVLAALVGVLIYKYANDAKNDAKKPYKSVSVLVAAKAIPTGTSFSSALESGQIARAQRVQRDLPSTRVSGELSDEALKKNFATLVAAHNIVPGQAIVSQDFVAQGQAQGGLTGALQTDQAKDKANELMAVTLTLDDQHAVGGFVSPGDTVNAVFTGDFHKPDQPGSGDSGGVRASAFLLPGLKVIAVGSDTTAPTQTTTAATGSTSNGAASSSSSSSETVGKSRTLITFEVTPRQALQLVQATDKGRLTLTLNPSSFKKGDFKDTAEIVEAINLFDKKLPLVDQALAQVKSAG